MSARTADPPLTRGHKKKERTRRRLLDAAFGLVAERGEAFSVADVVERADVSHGTFYNHFPDRDALVDAVVDELLTGLARSLEASVGEPDPVQRFASITALAIRRATTDPRGVEALHRLGVLPRVLERAGPLRHVRADLAACVATGRMAIDHEDAAVDVVFGAMVMASMRGSAAGVDADREEATVAHLLRALGLDAADVGPIAGAARRRVDELTDDAGRGVGRAGAG